MKTKIYLLIFSILIIFAGYTLYSSGAKSNTDKEREFKVENFEKVTEIKISDRNGKDVHLKKENNTWILNGKYPVRKHLFTEMERALTKMEAKSPVPKIGTEAVLTQMISGALKVQVFKGKKLDKVIHIGGPNLTNDASHMFLEIDGKASSQIYNVGIPGFNGFLTTRFVVDEDEWRAKDIFSYAPNQVKNIEVKYFNNATNQDYILTRSENNSSLKIGGKEYSESQLDERNITNYLIKLDNQQVVDYVFTEPNTSAIKDSLVQVNKYAELSITNTKNVTQHFTIIDMPLHESSKQQYDEKGDPMKYDVDYKFIIFGEKKDWGIITNEKFGVLLADPEVFVNRN